MTAPQRPTSAVRPSPFAGTWYTSDPQELGEQVAHMLEDAPPWDPARRARALVSPHAGLRYSGPTAAHGYACVASGDFARVVVLAPSHRFPLRGVAVDPSSHYETPLGRMEVDQTAVETLAALPNVRCERQLFESEHAIEMQLPFVQTLFPDARLVPVLVGDLRGDDYGDAARALDPIVDEETLVIVSSDFMHYGRDFAYEPFTDDVPENIRRTDQQAIDTICQRDFASFQRVLEETGNTVCGRKPLGVLLRWAPETWHVESRFYTTSGAITGDFTHCVSYASLVFWEELAPPTLGRADKAQLLRLARRRLQTLGDADASNDTLLAASAWAQSYDRPSGVFVTLRRRRGGGLRGCIGSVRARAPLPRAVLENTCAAATRDPRFPAVESHEVDGLEIEISVLGPLHTVDDLSDVQIGRDGLLVTHGLSRGLLLPQVATQFGWGREEFAENTCRKAGLPADAWRKGALLQRFVADVFTEVDFDSDG